VLRAHARVVGAVFLLAVVLARLVDIVLRVGRRRVSERRRSRPRKGRTHRLVLAALLAAEGSKQGRQYRLERRRGTQAKATHPCSAAKSGSFEKVRELSDCARAREVSGVRRASAERRRKNEKRISPPCL